MTEFETAMAAPRFSGGPAVLPGGDLPLVETGRGTLTRVAPGARRTALARPGGTCGVPGDGGTVAHLPMLDRDAASICFGGGSLRTACVTRSSSGRPARMPGSHPGPALRFAGP